MPAKVIKYRFDDEVIKKLLELQWWEYGADILKGLDISNPDMILGRLEERIENSSVSKYISDKYEIRPFERTVVRIKPDGERILHKKF